jgi:hypothetical protein
MVILGMRFKSERMRPQPYRAYKLFCDKPESKSPPVCDSNFNPY